MNVNQVATRDSYLQRQTVSNSQVLEYVSRRVD